MTHPIANARLRPIIAPTFAPVIIKHAITSVYAVIAPWIPVTVVPTSLATVAIETFMTLLSSVIRNWAAASVRRTSCARPPACSAGSAAAIGCEAVTVRIVRCPSALRLHAAGMKALLRTRTGDRRAHDAVVLALASVVAEAGLLEQAPRAAVEEGRRDLLAAGVLRVRLHDATAGLRDQIQSATEGQRRHSFAAVLLVHEEA